MDVPRRSQLVVKLIERGVRAEDAVSLSNSPGVVKALADETIDVKTIVGAMVDGSPLSTTGSAGAEYDAIRENVRAKHQQVSAPSALKRLGLAR